MASRTADDRSSRPLLTLGRVDRVRVQVGYRVRPDGPAYQQFLLDLPVPGADGAGDGQGLDEPVLLTALEPVLYAGAEAPRHYSVHQHRWHTSWGPSPGALDVGILVTTGSRTTAVAEAAQQSVTRAFRDVMGILGTPEPTSTTRDDAVLRARRSIAAAYALDPDALSLSAEEHHPAANSWVVGLRSAAGDRYAVVVGLVDGYAGSVRVRLEARSEVFDAVGSE